MLKALLDLALVFGGIAGGLALGLVAMRLMRRSTRSGAFALASALFVSFGVVNGGAQEMIQESAHETRRKKDRHSGDPPETGETD